VIGTGRPPARLLAMTAAAVATVWLAGAAPAHHVGAYTPRDNDVTANFKQLKSAVQAGKFDVALRLFEAGAVRRDMLAQAGRLPPGLADGTRAALEAHDAREVERHLMVFFLALTRDLVREAERRLGEPGAPVDARVAAGRKFLEAIWRYYNLVDFAVSQRDNRASVAVRLAFDEAEGFARPTTSADPARMRAPLRRIADVLTTLIETSSPRRES
jgi:hypothetical protein